MKRMLNQMNTEEHRHLKLLLFWPLFGVVFAVLTWGVNLDYQVVFCKMDNDIPFIEYFVLPYSLWYLFFVGFPAYTLIADVEAFKNCMKHLIITCTVSLLIFVIYPTEIGIRPEIFERENIFTYCVGILYIVDKGANIFPSLHVLITLVILTASWNSKQFCRTGWRIAFSVFSLLVILSTVFVKQHSVLDIFAAVVLWLATCPLVSGLRHREKGKK